MSLFSIDSSRGRRSLYLALSAALTLVACGDDTAAGGSPAGGSNQGGSSSGPGGNNNGAGPQGGDAPGGQAEGGNAQGGSAQGGDGQGGSAQGGSGEGGQGGGGSTLDITALCTTACTYFATCFKGTPDKCIIECSADLGDCSASQLEDVDACNQAVMNDCDLVNDFETCLQAVGCVTGV